MASEERVLKLRRTRIPGANSRPFPSPSVQGRRCCHGMLLRIRAASPSPQVPARKLSVVSNLLDSTSPIVTEKVRLRTHPKLAPEFIIANNHKSANQDSKAPRYFEVPPGLFLRFLAEQ